MKKYTFIAAILLAFTTLSPAQTTAVPNFISYQGRVVDASGNNVGTGTPVNRTVIFRIWDNPSSTNTANLIYSEAQTVTVSEGEFSVLVGQGVANLTQTFGYPETGKKLADLATAFDGSTRYLGVTVAAAGTIAPTDNEITPRQQIVSTAFAMRAKFAESIGTSSDLTLNPLSGTASNYGLGWYGTGRSFGVTAVDGPVLYGNAGGALGSSTGSTKNIALRWNAAGAVGIGSADLADVASTTKLVVQGDDSNNYPMQLNIRGNTDTNKRLLLGYNTTSNYASMQAYSAASGTTNLRLNPAGGNVGINNGTAAPAQALDVTGSGLFSGSVTASSFVGSGASLTGIPRLAAQNTFTQQQTINNSSSAVIQMNNTGAAAGRLIMGVDPAVIYSGGAVKAANDSVITTLGSGKLHLTTQYVPNGITIDISGNVGIGTTTPTKAKLEVNGAAGNHSLTTTFREYSKTVVGGVGSLPNTTGANSIYASGRLAGQDFIAFSDLRIKRVEGHSDPSQDLAALRGIEVTDYTYIDTVAKTPGKYKKAIAQQVEKVYPLAVSRSTDVVPDIYRKAMVENGWLMLATDLKKGERVRLIGEKKEGIHEVLEVAEGRFRTDFAAEGDEVFVYGREVDDFRSVDYEAISMLNVSATQELARKLDEKNTQIAALQKRLATLEAKDAARDAKMAAIEKLLASPDQPATRTVSLKTAE